ncbi:MAG: NAD(P)-dependent oxidoreductase [Alphaproteobacteria bacterium]|nr:NAD(P)-dependent oxidoreductase [Alphaproteobacteria bacterium]
MGEHYGFIGIGSMGLPMAGRLLDAGHALTVFDARAEAMAPLVAKGAKRAGSVRDVAAAAETVFMSLPTPDVVEKVATGPGGIAEGGKVRILVDLSTTGPRVTQALAQALAGKGIALVDSPVSGGVGGAQKGTLAVMVACERGLYQRLLPALEVIGKVFFVGDRPGLGQTMKLCNNLLSAAAMAISSEAMVLGVKAGLDPQVMCDVINAGSGANTAVRDKFPRSIIPRRFDYGFQTGLMYKDVKLCVEEAEAMGVPMWVASAVRNLWLDAQRQLGPASDFTRVVTLIEERAGVEVRKQGGQG